VAETRTIALPDVGDFKDIEIIEILVAAGDQVEQEQSIIVLESDKATMEIPSPYSGTIESILASVGDRVNEGDAIATISTAGAEEKPAEPEPVATAEPEPTATPDAPAPPAPEPPPASGLISSR
jgi:pyruvate/2-oxoglutarate dehydrogenase complex dihydrolipoamide acyltransferase (E2) component